MAEKEVIILGRGQSWRDCPFDAECWAIASVLNMPEVDCRKINKVFAFDDFESTRSERQIAKQFNIPVVSNRSYATEKYPSEEILREFGKTYFLPSVSYMIAYAIYKGYKKLRLYGVDQAPEWNHLINKPYVMFWLGVATGRGVEWELSKYSILLETMGDEIEKSVIALKSKAKVLREQMEAQQRREVLCRH